MEFIKDDSISKKRNEFADYINECQQIDIVIGWPTNRFNQFDWF